MLDILYENLNKFRDNITNNLDIEIINKKEKECGVNFPKALKSFYLYFGNDKRVLTSYYEFDEIEDIRIEKNALTFGYNHQRNGRLGITLKNLNSKFQSISWYSYERETWFSEGAVFPESFFFNIACWQVLNTMPSVAKIHVSQIEFEELVDKYFCYFSNEKVYLKGYNVVSIYSNDILGCYVKDDEELYLGTQKDDEILEDCEEKLNIDLDWL